jgi:hypothetical protein
VTAGELATGTADLTAANEQRTILRETLHRALAHEDQNAPAIIGLERTSLSTRSSYRTELLTLRLGAGSELRIFLKDYGACKHVKEYSLGAGGVVDRRVREMRVYRELLALVDLGTARFHGAVWDESRRWFWLLLEYVEGRRLGDFAFEHWVEAARWLGRMQGRFAGTSLREFDFLVEHDRAFFSSIAEDAVRATRATSARLGASLSSTLSAYDELLDVMSADRSALVHGVYRPYNIIVCPQAGHRVCVLDWEECARGSPLYDLACLSDGFEREPPRFEVVLDGYREEAAAHGVALPHRDGLHRLIHAFCLHRNLKTLTKARTRRFAPEGVRSLVDRVQELARLVW